MTDKAHAHTLELIPAYALGSLDAEEATRVDDHLAECAACRQELHAYEAVVDALPLAAPMVEPSPELKDRLVAQIGATPGGERAPASGWRARLRAGWESAFASPRWQPVALIVIAVLALSNMVLWQRINQLADQPRPVVLMGTEAVPDAWGLLVPGEGQNSAVLVVDGLPALEPSQQYQLWLVRDGQRDDGGVFSVSESGYVNLPVAPPENLSQYTAFGVTVEPAGGSPGPTGPRVLGSNP